MNYNICNYAVFVFNYGQFGVVYSHAQKCGKRDQHHSESFREIPRCSVY